ncbi:hypothetical protein SeMB42_g03702 [Synchytrium endobioticum]|uniref:Uncharacterized protein n=1 Tax=Synchytrium endobioticum TaxID=286115 RepID=A0A507D4R6_9FUNG|nr:hypothetical protein SeMB42_g03702 [Synchytrium endobioticum]
MSVLFSRLNYGLGLLSPKGLAARLLNQALIEGTKMALGGARNTNQKLMLALAGVQDAESTIKKSKSSIKKQLTQSAENQNTLAFALMQDHTKWPMELLTAHSPVPANPKASRTIPPRSIPANKHEMYQVQRMAQPPSPSHMPGADNADNTAVQPKATFHPRQPQQAQDLNSNRTRPSSLGRTANQDKLCQNDR